MNSDEIRGHEKDILTKQNIVIIMIYLLYKSKCCMTISWLDRTKEMGIAYNPFLDSGAGSSHRNHEVTELWKL